MHKLKSVLARRAWNLLRLALLWARKGGLFKNRRLMVDLRLLPKFINKALGTTSSSNDYYHHHLHYGERQLSFDDTPVIRVKMYRPSSLRFKMPHIPCITGGPQVDFDDHDFDRHYCSSTGHDAYDLSEGHDDVVLSRKSVLLKAAGNCITSDEEEERDDDDVYSDHSNIMVCDHQETNETPRSCDDGIDLKAEQFIAEFYQQIKLQRQISYLQYHDMISRGAS